MPGFLFYAYGALPIMLASPWLLAKIVSNVVQGKSVFWPCFILMIGALFIWGILVAHEMPVISDVFSVLYK